MTPVSRRYEAYARWTVYCVVSTAAAAVLWAPNRSALLLGLAVPVIAGNVLVARRGFDRGGPLPTPVVVGWGLMVVGFLGAAVWTSGPGLAVAAVVGSAAASVVPMLDARRTGLVSAVAVVVALPLVAAVAPVPVVLVGAGLVVFDVWTCWASAWTVRVLQELRRTQEDRAALELANERLRISRDLHDVFGRTLATISVKSELAAELLRRGRDDRAAAEMVAVRELAGAAGSEVRRIVAGELRTTWSDELSGARSLLRAAGIECAVDGGPVPDPLALVLREGVTNVLRHSTATRVRITTSVADGEARLVLANDGARASGITGGNTGGTGLRSLADRLDGTLDVRRDGEWFVLEARVRQP
jgi:two-component system, NarL family, sensor histidine kinase DesK